MSLNSNCSCEATSGSPSDGGEEALPRPGPNAGVLFCDTSKHNNRCENPRTVEKKTVHTARVPEADLDVVHFAKFCQWDTCEITRAELHGNHQPDGQVHKHVRFGVLLHMLHVPHGTTLHYPPLTAETRPTSWPLESSASPWQRTGSAFLATGGLWRVMSPLTVMFGHRVRYVSIISRQSRTWRLTSCPLNLQAKPHLLGAAASSFNCSCCSRGV